MESKCLLGLCFLTIFTFIGCSTTSRSVAEDGSTFRAPEGDYRTNNNNKEMNRQFVREKY